MEITAGGQVKLWVEEELGIVYSQPIEGAVIGYEEALEVIRIRRKLQGGRRMGLLSDPRGVRKVDCHARKVLSENASKKDLYAVALLAENAVSRMVANMAVGFNRPEVPTKVFSDRNKAISWLLEQKALEVGKEEQFTLPLDTP